MASFWRHLKTLLFLIVNKTSKKMQWNGVEVCELVTKGIVMAVYCIHFVQPHLKDGKKTVNEKETRNNKEKKNTEKKDFLFNPVVLCALFCSFPS